MISRFRKTEQIVICRLKIVLNILCQFSAHTSRIVMLNMHVNFMRIRFLVADLGFLVIEISRFRKIKQIVICKFSAHASRTVMLNMHVNFISIQFLVVELGF